MIDSIRQFFLDPRDAWISLLRRPLRSLLSSLGIGIGVAALVAMLSISEGAKKKALAKIHSLGTNTLRIENNIKAVKVGNSSAANLSSGLTISDAVSINSWVGKRGVIGSFARLDNVEIISQAGSFTGTILAVSDEWFRAEGVKIDQGRSLTYFDQLGRSNYCVIGNNVAKRLKISINATLQLGKYPVRVVGIQVSRGRLLTEGTGLSSIDFDSTVIVPITYAPFVERVGGSELLDGMVVLFSDNQRDKILHNTQQIKSILLKKHSGLLDFIMVVPFNLLREAEESQRLFSLIMGSIAGLSLLVGGIGVMNVMLANISEQTREIGLRMAVGASKFRVICLYLWNSVLLTVMGVVWGSVTGLILAWAIQRYAGWEIAFSVFSLLIAPMFAIGTGVIFGLHPALRAASLNPSLALRDA